MSDTIDKAQYQSELILQQQIRIATQKTSLPTRTHCVDCDEPIPLIRQQKVTGCQRCVACQSEFETGKARSV